MPYITIMQTPRTRQVSIEDIIEGRVPLGFFAPAGPTTGTMTFFVDRVNDKYKRRYSVPGLIALLERFNESHAELFDKPRDSLYHKFYIPKKSGGYREINEPLPPLMDALRSLKSLFEIQFGVLYHTAAFAYVKGRCTIDAVKKHQQNESKWFLKTDFSDFFGSTNEDFVFRMFSLIFPFSEVVASEAGANALRKALSLCFLNGGLPQGTCISPLITNTVMIPIDHRIMNDLVKRGYVYTRYADDSMISHRNNFKPSEMCQYIDSVLESFQAPFKLKPSKTRYGSSSGRNWNLGVMLNKNNEITIGRKKKLQLKAACVSFVRDCQKGILWDPHDLQVLNGQMSYYKMVEKRYINEFVKWFNEKYHVNLVRMIRDQIKMGQIGGV